MRPDIELVLAGGQFVLRPTFASLAALEAELNLGLVTLARRFVEGQLTLAELKAIIAAGIKGAGHPPPDNLGDLLLESGVASVAAPITSFLEAALSGVPPKK